MSDFPKNAKVQWSVMGGGCVRDLNHKDSFLLTSLAQISLIRSRFLGCHAMLHPTKCCVMTLKTAVKETRHRSVWRFIAYSF